MNFTWNYVNGKKDAAKKNGVVKLWQLAALLTLVCEETTRWWLD